MILHVLLEHVDHFRSHFTSFLHVLHVLHENTRIGEKESATGI